MVGLKIFLIVLALAALVVLTLKITKKKEDSYDEAQYSVRGWGLAAGVAIFLLVIMLVGAIGQIPAGYRGVVLNFGAVTSRTLNEGIYMVTPLVNTVEMMDVQTHAYEAEAGAASKDMQNVHTKVTLNYALDPTKANETYQTLRRDYLERIIKPAVQESVKATTARFNAEELITKRPVVKSEIELALKDRLAVHGVLSETISITDFTFDPLFTKSIEEKMAAAQDALKAENKLRQIEVEARQVETAARGQANAAIAAAEGERQSAILRAEGNAQAIIIVAESQAEANVMLAESLKNNPELLRYILYNKLGDKIKVIILPSGQEFILGPEVLGGE